MAQVLKDMAIMNSNASKKANDTYNAFRTKDRALLKGMDDLEQMYGQYEIPGSTNPIDAMRGYNALLEVNSRGVEQVYEHEYTIPDFEFTQSVYEGNPNNGKVTTSTRFNLSDNGLADLNRTSDSWIESGFQTKNGMAKQPSPEHETWYDETDDEVRTNYIAELNAAKSDEEINELYKSVSRKLMLDKVMAKKTDKTETENYTPPSDGGKGKFSIDDYRITEEDFANSELIVEGDGGDESIVFGTGTRQVSGAPRTKVNVTHNGNKVSGEIQKLTRDDEGNRIAIINVRVKGSNEEGSARDVIAEKAVPVKEIQGQLDKEELDLYDQIYKRMGDEITTKGLGQVTVDKLNEAIDKKDDSWFSDTEEAKEIISSAGLDGIVSNVEDPKGGTDIQFDYNGETHSFNIDDSEGKIAFLKLVRDIKKNSGESGINWAQN